MTPHDPTVLRERLGRGAARCALAIVRDEVAPTDDAVAFHKRLKARPDWVSRAAVIARAVRDAMAEECEACARIVETEAAKARARGLDDSLTLCMAADAIRARGEVSRG